MRSAWIPSTVLQASPYGRLKSNILYWRMRLEKHIDGDAFKANTADRSSVSRSSMVATFHKLMRPRLPENDLRRHPLRTINQTDGELQIFIPIPHQCGGLHLRHHAWGRTHGFWRFMLDASHGAEDIGTANKRLDVRVLIAEAI